MFYFLFCSCIGASSIPTYDWHYSYSQGTAIPNGERYVITPEQCSALCDNDANCYFWTLTRRNTDADSIYQCSLKGTSVGRISVVNTVSGTGIYTYIYFVFTFI